nr:RagB/SusD family nutrient uptake outer membrane protein [Cytophagales bacterium]
ARTKAAASDHLANNPLRYERWAEFVCEGQWWFDVCRWRIGAQESSYYQAVMSGPINWNDNKYAMPIPEAERLNNTLITQNPGY